jgi:phosphoribosylformimino-5-aminoimidazole carboxamide ribotide isomerase
VEVIPAIDLRGGRCVRLVQGDYNREIPFSDDPVATAQRWQREGATRLHVVDLDGAREGRPVNDEAVRSIIDAVPLPIEVAGGVRDVETIQMWLDAGADRVVLGSAAARNPALAGEAAQRYGERMLVSIDARDGLVATEGWTEGSEHRADELLRRLAALGVPRFVYTDIARDGTLTSPNFEVVASLVQTTDAPIIAAGGVASAEHLTQLAELGCEGAIVGLALYDGRIELREAMRALGEAASS